MARDISPTELAELVNEETVKTFIDLSIAYTKLYQENPRAFIMAFRKFKSIRMASAFIVTVYKSQGLLKEYNYLVNWLDRINATATHQLDALRTIISYRKTEFSALSYGT